MDYRWWALRSTVLKPSRSSMWGGGKKMHLRVMKVHICGGHIYQVWTKLKWHANFISLVTLISLSKTAEPASWTLWVRLGPDRCLCLIKVSSSPSLPTDQTQTDFIALSLTSGFNSCFGEGGQFWIFFEEREDLDVEDLERCGVWELQICPELSVASSNKFAYGVPALDVSNFVSLMIYVSSYFPSHCFGILYKVESCIAT